MYFHSQIPFGTPQRIDFTRYLRDFDFEPYIYEDKRAEYAAYLATSDKFSFIADIAGAVFASLFREGYIDKDSYRHVIDCCRDIVIDLGFAETDDTNARRVLRPDGGPNGRTNFVLIAGCQDAEMLERRVVSAVDFVSQLDYNCEVIFSGKSPDPTGKRRVKIPDESMRMLNLFKSHLSKRNHAKLPLLHPLRQEDRSSTTKTNVSRVFGEILKQRDNINLIVVSSTFHLIRLSQEVKRNIALEENAELVSNVVLIGAEDSRDFFRVYDAPYFKLAMFDVFHYLLTRNLDGAAPGASEVQQAAVANA